MKRLYPNKVSRNRETFFSIVENQIEYLYDYEFGSIKDLIDEMTPEQYERFLTDVWNDFLDDSNIWQNIDDSITEYAKKRLDIYISQK